MSQSRRQSIFSTVLLVAVLLSHVVEGQCSTVHRYELVRLNGNKSMLNMKNVVVGNPNNPTAPTTYIVSEGTTTSVPVNQGYDKDTMTSNPNNEGGGDKWEDARRPTNKPTGLRTPRTSAPTSWAAVNDDDDAYTRVTPAPIVTPEPATPAPTPCESRKWYLQVILEGIKTESGVTTCTNGYDTTAINESSKYGTFLECCEAEARETMDNTDCKYIDVCNTPVMPPPSPIEAGETTYYVPTL